MMEPHRKGEVTEAVVVAELKKRGVPVSIPFGDNERYDAVLETPDGQLVRAQIKTGRYDDGVIRFHTKTQHTNSQGNVYKHYGEKIDCFIVYSHELECLFLIDVDAFDTSIQLRVDPPEIEQSGINWAEDYAFDLSRFQYLKPA